jgi:putative intracellular protease/amidase
MVKKVTVVAPNPVNGSGLFQYLEAFFENKIPYKTFAVAESKEIKTNSGITVVLDDVVGNLKGHEDEYDAIVFSCGDALIKFKENVEKPYNQVLIQVVKAFADKGKLFVGHCGSAMICDSVGIGEGKKMAIHPYGKPFLKKVVGTDDKFTIDGNFYTAQTENTIGELLPELLNVLKK